MLFWSGEGSNSEFVKWEYKTAEELGKRVCLIKFPDVPEPVDWDLDVEWVELEGVRFLARATLLTGGSRVWLDPRFENMMRKVQAFAQRARDAAG